MLLLLPVYNEERYISELLLCVRKSFSGSVLVVDDGSTDSTPGYLENLLAEKKIDHIISHGANCGYGRALIDGFRFAAEKGHDFVITMDCDIQHLPSFIKNFESEKASGADVVSGSRYLDRSLWESSPPEDRYLINMRITTLINSITGYRLTDSFCGFKMYRVSALRKLDLQEDGYGLPCEFWIKAAYAGFRVKEIPVPLIYKDFTRNFKNMFTSDKDRYAYYLGILEREKKYWLQSGLGSFVSGADAR